MHHILQSSENAVNNPPSGANAPLGNITVFTVTPEEKRRETIKRRYRLQDSAALVLEGAKNKAGKNIGWKVKTCCRVRVNMMAGIQIEVSEEHQRARFGNVMLCERFWMCPVCAARMSERDKHRLVKVTAAAGERGWLPVLLTYTQRHNFGSDLRQLLDTNAAARSWVKSGSRFKGDNWKSIKEHFGIVASVINLEITHGDEGWHPHNHEILFIDPAKAKFDGEAGSHIFWAEMRRLIARRWKAAVAKYGGDCDLNHGFDLKPGDRYVTDYISKFGHEPLGSKWSIESEITKSPVKLARKKGRTPFQLLGDWHDGDDKQAGVLFREYACNFEGKHRLHGLTKVEKLLALTKKVKLLPDEVSEEVQAPRLDWQPVIELPVNNVAWHLLCKAGKRADFMLGALESYESALDVLASIGYRGKPPVDLREQGKLRALNRNAPNPLAGAPPAADLPVQKSLPDGFSPGGHGVLDGG